MAFHDDSKLDHFTPITTDSTNMYLNWESTKSLPSVKLNHEGMDNTNNDTISRAMLALNESMSLAIKTTAAMDQMSTKVELPSVVDEMMSMVFESNDTMSVIVPDFNPMAVSMSELKYVRTITAIIMTIMFALVNLAMGASIGKVELMRQWRVPGSVLVGCLTQFILFPLVAFMITLFFKLPSPYVTGMMLVAICPGGAMANVVTYFIDANISICTSMVLITTVMSMGYVPIMLLILSGGSKSGSVAVAMWAIGVAIVIIAVPLAIGVLIRSYKETWGQVIAMIGITGGLLTFTANSLFHLIIHTQVFHAPARIYIATILVIIVGFAIAMFVPFLFRQHPTSRHTLATHAVFHNTSLTMLIICTVFSTDPHWRELVVIPSIYGPLAAMFGIIYIVVYLTLLVSREDSSHQVSAYLPINEEARGNGDYMTLEGDDDNMGVKFNIQNGFRLKMKDYEVMQGTITPAPTTAY